MANKNTTALAIINKFRKLLGIRDGKIRKFIRAVTSQIANKPARMKENANKGEV